MTKQNSGLALIIVLATALTACGGGGGSAPSPAAPGSSPVASPSVFVDTVDANSGYVAGTYADVNRALALDRLNHIRLSVGLGVLRQVSQIDVAAQAHSNWLSLNDSLGHYETPGTNGFTGATPQDRLLAAGYNYYRTEVQSTATVSQPGDWYVDSLMSAPYHRLAMLLYRADEAGVGYSDAFPSSVTIDLGTNPGQGAPGALAVLWPLANATGLPVVGDPEAPDPIPENNGASHGYPVSLHTHESRRLTVTAFTLTDASGGSVATKLLTYATDTNLRSVYVVRHFAALVPRAPLAANTTYTAHFVGAIEDVPFSKDWSFSTQ